MPLLVRCDLILKWFPGFKGKVYLEQILVMHTYETNACGYCRDIVLDILHGGYMNWFITLVALQFVYLDIKWLMLV